MIEVESKFRIAGKQKIANRLKELGFIGTDPVHQSDKVFLVKSDSFKTFTPGDPVARIRTVNGVSSMTVKRAINASGDSVEHEMTVDPASAAEGSLLEMGYKAVTDVEKIRTEYKRDDTTVAIDEVSKLGEFLEIEIVCNEGKEANARDRVMAIATDLGLSEDDIVTKKYDQMMSEL
jgi:adenylate cyclase class 2